MPINRRGKLPLYQQLYEILRSKIKSGEWKIDQMIPSEPELMDAYKVSRVTVRQVTEMLVEEGLIIRQQGKGSFVSTPTLEQSMTRIISFTEDMQQRGLNPGTKELSAELISAPDEIANHLQVESGTELARLQRLRLANDEPLSIEESFLVHGMVEGILQYDFVKQPLRGIIESKFNIRIVRAKQVIRAIAAKTNMANALNVPLGSPLLYITRISYTQYDQPIEFLKIYYRGDRYSLYNELHD